MARTPPLLALALLLVAMPAAAQSRLELFGAIPIPVTTVEGTFTSDYVPSLVNGGTAITGRGGQTLQLGGGRPLGWLAGANWLISPHAGVQVFVGRASHAIGGAKAPTCRNRIAPPTIQPEIGDRGPDDVFSAVRRS